jgi:hypothetical protein
MITVTVGLDLPRGAGILYVGVLNDWRDVAKIVDAFGVAEEQEFTNHFISGFRSEPYEFTLRLTVCYQQYFGLAMPSSTQ